MTMFDGPQPPERRLFSLLGQANRRVWRAAEQASMEQLGITPAQIGALYAVRPGADTPLACVGQQLDLSPAALSGLVDRMVDAGLIERRRDTGDGRAVLLRLTPHGERLRAESFPLLARFNAALADGFTDAEIEVVLRFLRHVVRRCESAETLLTSEGSHS